ncbi:Collagen type IV alpha-3-binding protein [Thelohanellus kitauei]|uniref:Collagen type IV alpha-3-binding protein n=1 Tax=Thelohanellus kitauei TaxID=669202 RepID=A0A0C2N1K3_THEKT|nr:Collagen type IV alpha-3-binding protein [Thelohanellus kitauei]
MSKDVAAKANINQTDAELFDDKWNSDMESPIELSHQGFLLKWTNYLYGWQRRYVILKNGTLLYSDKKQDSNFNGIVSLYKSVIRTHSTDDLRFEISTGDMTYYFRAKTPEERVLWLQKLQSESAHRAGKVSHSTCSSFSSLSSFSSSSTALSFSSKRSQTISENLNQISKMKENIFDQIDRLKASYDFLIEFVDTSDRETFLESGIKNLSFNNPDLDNPSPASTLQIDSIVAPGYIVKRPLGHRYTKSTSQFLPRSVNLSSPDRGSLLRFLQSKKCNISNDISQFRTTTMGLMSCVSSCIEYIEKAEKEWNDELEKERENTKKLQKKISELTKQLERRKAMTGPDAFDGSAPSEGIDEIFYDAICSEIALQDELEAASDKAIEKAEVVENPYQKKLEDFENETLPFLTCLPTNDNSWSVVYNVPPTIMFKKEILIDNIVMDPYRAVHICKGSTAKEISMFFWDVKHRLQIDSHVDNCFVKAEYGPNIVVFHQIHKTIWPVVKRDSLIISRRKEVDDNKIKLDLLSLMDRDYHINEGYDIVGNSWMVSNLSIDYPDVPVNNRVRVDARVSLLAQTFIKKSADTSSRGNYYTMINYSASINPGGWLPINAVREIGKREIPKFLKNLSHVSNCLTASTPIDI